MDVKLRGSRARASVHKEHWRADGKYLFLGNDCIGIFDTDNDHDEVMEARAALASLAPSLLSALEQIEQQLDYGQHAASLKIARAAIAKATGQGGAI